MERLTARRRNRRRRVLGVGAALVVVAGAGTAIALAIPDGDDPSPSEDSEDRSTPDSTTPPPTQPATSSVPPPNPDLLGAVSGRTIVVDPGHNGANGQHAAEINRPIDIGTQTRACDTTGAQTNAGYTESEYNFDVSVRLAQLLRDAGANVMLTRETDDGWGPCIDERAAIGNRAQAAVAVSVHADGGPAGGRGFHIIYPPSLPGLTDDIAAESVALALDMRSAYQQGTGMPYANYIATEALSERADLGGLNLSDVPKVFVETGNMRNAEDAALLTDPGFRQRVAMAIATGLAAYLASRS